MGDSCDGFVKWAADIYWNNFQFTHFFQILSGGFQNQLVIPKKFWKNSLKKLPLEVTLKGPSGSTWDVGLVAESDTMCLGRGWPEFVRDHSLVENDLLVFRYDGVSQLDVLIFDGHTFCEKESSYFVRKWEHKKRDSGCLFEKKHGECSVGVKPTKSKTVVMSDSSEDSMEDGNANQRSVPEVASKSTTKKGTLENGSTLTPTKRPRRTREVSTPNTGDHTPRKSGSTVGRPARRRGSKAKRMVVNSKRRGVTEEEKENALKLAKAASTDDSLIAVMKPTHVYKGFCLYLAHDWVKNHISPVNQDVVLRVGGKSWVTKYHYDIERNSGRLSVGWKDFALDNGLEEFDACLFQPSNEREEGPKLLDVKIFRVVPQIIP